MGTDGIRQAKTELLRQAGHRARNCLNGVVGLAELLGCAGAPQDPDLCASLVTSGRELRSILQPLLDVATADPDMPDEPRSLQVRPLLEEIAGFHLLLARGRRIEVSCEIAEDAARMLRADRLKFVLLIHLLVACVVGACDEGGRVIVSIDGKGGGRLGIAGRPAGTAVHSAKPGDQSVSAHVERLADLSAALGTRVSVQYPTGAIEVSVDLPSQ